MAESIPGQWAERARYDLDTARAMLESKRHLYVLFCCQQAVEKMLKAVIAERSGQCPPRLHNLMPLAKHAGLEPDASQSRLMRELSEYYVQSRYPDQLEVRFADVPRETVQEVLNETEGLVQWLLSLM